MDEMYRRHERRLEGNPVTEEELDGDVEEIEDSNDGSDEVPTPDDPSEEG